MSYQVRNGRNGPASSAPQWERNLATERAPCLASDWLVQRGPDVRQAQREWSERVHEEGDDGG